MNKIVEIKFGSHLYGTTTPKSDLDLKGIYIPTPRQIILGKYPETITKSRPKAVNERNNKDDIDVEILSLGRYLDLLMEGQTMALDILFAPDWSYTDNTTENGRDIMSVIKANKDKLLTRNVNAFVGYARQQAARYGIKGSRMDSLKRTKELLDSLVVSNGYLDKLSNYEHAIQNLVEQSKELVSLEKTPLIEIVMLKGPKGDLNAPHLKVNGRSIPFHAKVKYAQEVVGKMLDSYGGRATKAHLAGGVDWKALSHAVRVNTEAQELLATGSITFPRPDSDLLLKIKTEQMPKEQVFEIIEHGVADLYEAQAKSTLREEPDRAWAEDFLYYVYDQTITNSKAETACQFTLTTNKIPTGE